MDGVFAARSDVGVAPVAPALPVQGPEYLPTFWQGFRLFVLSLLLAFILEAAGRIFGWALGAFLGRPVEWLTVLASLPEVLGLGAVLYLGRRRAQLSWKEALPFGLPRATQVGAFLVLFVGLELLTQGVNQVVDGWLPPVPGFLERAFASLPLVHIVLVGPVLEELFCRGLVLGGMRRRYSTWKAIGLSTLLFAVMHANPWQLAVPLMVGVVFGWVVVRTGTLWLPVVGHVLHNGRAMLEESDALTRFLSFRGGPNAGGWLAAVVLVCAGSYLLARTTSSPRSAVAPG